MHALTLHRRPIELVAKLKEIHFQDEEKKRKRKSWADVDITKVGDVYGYVDETGRRHKGVIHQAVAAGELGARTASDLYDLFQRRSAAKAARAAGDYPSATVGRFKVTENSPNVARITYGPDKRERRKKYVWERVGVQRSIIYPGLATAALVAYGKTRNILQSEKYGGGSAVTGLKNIAGKLTARIKNVTGAAGAAMTGGTFKPKVFTPLKTPMQAAYEKGVAETEAKFKAVKTPAQKALETKAERYETGKGSMEPQLHPPGHPQAGQPIINPKTGKPKMRRRRKPEPGKIIPGPGSEQQAG
jgi:hypothetical protein